MAKGQTTVPREIKIARINNEWSMSWNHIHNISTVFWAIFAGQLIINGAIIFKIEQLNPTVAGFWLLIFNILVAFHYQKEHLMRRKALNQVEGLRRVLRMSNDDEKLLYFNCLKPPVFRADIVHWYFVALHLLFIAIPFYLLGWGGEKIKDFSCANFEISKCKWAFIIFICAAVWYVVDDIMTKREIKKHWSEKNAGR